MSGNADTMCRCFEIPARVERIVHLAGVSESMSDETFDLLSDDWAPLIEQHLGLDPLATRWLTVAEQREGLQVALTDKPLLGFIVEIATPEKTRTGRGWAYSWSCCTTKAFYGDSYEEAVDAGLSWAAGLTPS